MKDLFLSSGKSWDGQNEAQAKRVVGDAVSRAPGQALLAVRKSAFDTLVHSLEAKLLK
jgi:hypothetical protein